MTILLNELYIVKIYLFKHLPLIVLNKSRERNIPENTKINLPLQK